MKIKLAFVGILSFLLFPTANALACETRNLIVSGYLNRNSAISAQQSPLPPTESFANLASTAAAVHSASVVTRGGKEIFLKIYFYRVATNFWEVGVYAKAQEVQGGGPSGAVLLSAVEVEFVYDGDFQFPLESVVTMIPVWSGEQEAAQIDLALKLKQTSDETEIASNHDGGVDRCLASPVNDFDGDGRTDFAVYRPASGFWAVSLSGTSFTTMLWKQFGLFGDHPMHGDYTGDGKTDLVVWRPSTGDWHVCPSETKFDCSYSAWSEQFGLPGDLPISSDFDGDRISDFAVWRPSEGKFYYKGNSYSDPFVKDWGLKGDIPIATAPRR